MGRHRQVKVCEIVDSLTSSEGLTEKRQNGQVLLAHEKICQCYFQIIGSGKVGEGSYCGC